MIPGVLVFKGVNDEVGIKSFYALFKKELDSVIWITLPLTILMVGMMLYSLWAGENRIHHPANEYLNIFRINPTISYILAVAFLYSLVIERRTKTSFQLLSLPVHTSYVILTKILAVYTIGIFLIVVRYYVELMLFLIHSPLKMIMGNRHMLVQGGISPLVRFRISTPRFSDLIMQCGILSVSFGVSLFFKRRQVFWGVATYLLCLFVIKWTSDTLIWSDFGSTGIRNFPFLCGIVFMVLGSVLYEKFSEV